MGGTTENAQRFKMQIMSWTLTSAPNTEALLDDPAVGPLTEPKLEAVR